MIGGRGVAALESGKKLQMTASVTQCAVAATLLLGLPCSAQSEPAMTTDGSSSATSTPLDEITVMAQRIDLIGKASTASEGAVSDQEIQLLPAYRPGQILETVPGLIVTLHSGEGKANQYLLRGYNLDHGTDLETYVDDIPVNQPTHAHGQGYTDLNFMIPELADGITYTKGPYYADIGDFGAVGSVHMDYRDTIEDQVSATVGMYDFQRVLAAGSTALAEGNLLAAVEVQHYDGPFVRPDDARKENFVLRYSGGDEQNGYSVTGMYYHQIWNNTTDIPVRAITEGLIPDRFGTLDPTDGGHSQRASLSLEYHAHLGDGALNTNSFLEYSQLHLFNDFTRYLFNPVDGDQEDQFETRRLVGGTARYVLPLPVGVIPNEITFGALTRYDSLGVGRVPSIGQVPQPPGVDPVSFSDDDRVRLFAGGVYTQAITRWTPWFRSVLGVRDDYQHGGDVD